MSVRLRAALVAVRDDLRDLDSLPLLDTLIDVLASGDGPAMRRVAADLIDWFSYDEPTVPLVQLEAALDAVDGVDGG